ncbi:CBL-interacting protein kinase 22-like [Hordeum vulgare subsp. vulgare]|uniref:non-specific serine/threonine protein kinase n=1 Tax=Hordeum vulgare subsp. vulgare TaxID=112509 RepID=A0A8I6WZH6_HORVV|nr:CBL-interacting protein kinase 22-like [Hordeum vulgare subsp. vulgare]
MGPEDSPAADGYSKVLQGRYELGRVLGRGGSSKVYRARDIRTGVFVAVKAIRKPHHPFSPEMAATARRSVERELAALRRVKGHPHVMRLLDVLASRSTVYLVLELARGGTLLSAMDERGRFDEPTARRLFVQLVSALAHVHSRGVFHRDVKPENLLLDEHGDLKLTDFGLCTLAGRHLGADGLAATRCGSPAYVAPEILYKKRYDAGKVDVWSSGVALFSLTAGYLPFNDANLMGMYRKIFSGRFRCPRWFSPELRCLIGRMLDPNPDTRIKIGEIMEHPWLQQDGTSSFGNIIRAGSSDPRPEVMKWEAEMEQVRGLNAFHIIAFASGCDLSGLIGPLPDRVRFAVEGVDIGSVLDKAEEIGREEGFVMRRKEEVGCGGVMFEAIGKEIIALVRVSRLLEEMLVVEVERASSSEAPKLWEMLQLGLKFSND